MLVCMTTIVINLTPIWNSNDDQNLEIAKKRCSHLYQDAPCLIKFTKTTDQTYRAICGTKG